MTLPLPLSLKREHGELVATFRDLNGHECKLVATRSQLMVGMVGFGHLLLSREQVLAMLPHLQWFAVTGELHGGPDGP